MVLVNPTSAAPAFFAPVVGPVGETLTFRLVVNDGQVDSAPDEVTVTVQNVNQPPTANAGPDQTKGEGTLVTLNGAASGDPDIDPMTYQWSQVSGPTVALADPRQESPTFTAPPGGPGGVTFVFQLEVNDGQLTSLPDTVTITVLNVNDPPVATLARPTLASLWPPNHTFVSVGIVGVPELICGWQASAVSATAAMHPRTSARRAR